MVKLSLKSGRFFGENTSLRLGKILNHGFRYNPRLCARGEYTNFVGYFYVKKQIKE